MRSTKIALAYLILSFPIVIKGYIGPLIDFVIRLSINYLPVYLNRLLLYYLGKSLYFLFNPPLYIATHFSSQFSEYLFILFAFSFVYPFLSAFLISRFLRRFNWWVL